MANETWDRLVRLLGLPCLQYLTALDVGTSVDSQSPPEELTPEQSATLELLGEALPFDMVQSVPDFATRFEIAWRLGAYVPEYGGSWAVAIRRASGGSIDPTESTDPVVAELLQQLRDVYALMLLPSSMPAFGPDLSAALYGHPSRLSFEESVQADEDLARLFPHETASAGRSGSYIGPNRGGGIQLWGLPGQLLRVALDWARLDSPTPRLGEVSERLTLVVDLVRHVARGETVAIPARIALTGVRLPDEITGFDIGRSHLRKRDDRDAWLTDFTGTAGKLTTTTPDGQTVEIDYGGDVVIETTMDYRIHLGELETSDWPKELSALRQSLDHTIEAIRLALALTPSSDEPILVLPSWVVTMDPLGHGPNIGWQNTQRNSKLIPRQLTSTQVEQWRSWSERLIASKMSNIEIAVRRVLLAVGERQMPEDVLIDSIMAWENLFGAHQETMFRVCGSLAWLLTNDVGERKTLMKELKDIYGLRSRVVHGSASLKPSDSTAPQRALEIAMDALRVIFKDRADLLNEPDGSARSNRVLLGD